MNINFKWHYSKNSQNEVNFKIKVNEQILSFNFLATTNSKFCLTAKSFQCAAAPSFPVSTFSTANQFKFSSSKFLFTTKFGTPAKQFCSSSRTRIIFTTPVRLPSRTNSFPSRTNSILSKSNSFPTSSKLSTAMPVSIVRKIL